jgi:hypothetical protein
MKVINIFGGPGIGKSTQAYDLFVNLKKLGKNVDVIPEYAKKLVYRNATNILAKEQLYIFSKQIHEYRIREQAGVEIVICESPLPLSIVYNKLNSSEDFKYFDELVWHEFNKYENINIILNRETDYQNIGRYQDIDGAINVDNLVKNLIIDSNINHVVLGLENFVENSIGLLS